MEDPISKRQTTKQEEVYRESIRLILSSSKEQEKVPEPSALGEVMHTTAKSLHLGMYSAQAVKETLWNLGSHLKTGMALFFRTMKRACVL